MGPWHLAVQFTGIRLSPTPASLPRGASPSSLHCRVRIREGCDLLKATQPCSRSARPGALILCLLARVPSLLLHFCPSAGAAGASPLLRSTFPSLLSDLTPHAPHTSCYTVLHPSFAPASQFHILPPAEAWLVPTLGPLLCCFPFKGYTPLLSTQATPTQPSSSVPRTLPPGSLPGLLLPPDFLIADSRSAELSRYSQMLPPSLPGSLTVRAFSGMATVRTSAGYPALEEPTD